VTRQLIAIEFTPGGRSYTYHNDGPRVEVGEFVVVMTNRGPQTVEVVSAAALKPTVPTKGIVGKADRPPREPPRQGALL
jgi:hypothetical protein